MESKSKKTRLSEHFTLEELTYSRTAIENAIANEPPAQARISLQHLASCLLEPLRQLYKKPIAILSGYRNIEVNRLVGGVATSQHVKGEAADCYTPEGPEKLLELLMYSGLPFDQAILYRRRRFLHLSLKKEGRNRMQVLVYMVCVICLFSGCGIRRNVKQSENYSHEDSVHWRYNDSLLLQKRFVLHDSLSWELKRIEYFPPDSSGRQYLQSVAVARLLHSGSRTDSISVCSSMQQSYATRMVEQVHTQKNRSAISSRAIFWFAVSACLFMMGVIYVRRKRFL